MRLVWVVIPLILFGIVGIQSVEGQISPGSPFAADLSINNPPNLGETTDVTLTFIDLFSYYSDIEQFPATIRLPDGLELVSGELETMHFWQRGDTLDVTVTVKAIQTGNWTIQGFGFGGAADYLYLVIDEDSSYIHEGNFPSSTLSKYPVEKYREFYDELTQYKAPLKQIRDNGVLPKDVKCNEGKVLFFKASDNSPACVKPETAEKLIERGWINQLVENELVQYFNGVREKCKNPYYVEKYSSVEDCFNVMLPLYHMLIRETP